ncbi:MAG: hypothetical protein AB7U05_07150 [Mangrovibacterium sp.]
MMNGAGNWRLETGNWQLAPLDPEGIEPFITPNPIGGVRKIKTLFIWTTLVEKTPHPTSCQPYYLI